MSDEAGRTRRLRRPEPPTRRLSRLTLLNVYFRSFFIQAGFNPETMQALGLVFALEPAIEKLYDTSEERRAAMRRHLTPFNTHPYLAAGLVGGILHHEACVAEGTEPPARVESFKRALMGPLAALGDGFFWLSLRPATGALAIALVPLLHAWAALVLLIAYNIFHLWFRARLFMAGWMYGDGLLALVSRMNFVTTGQRLRTFAAFATGVAGATLIWSVGAARRDATWPGVLVATVSGLATLWFLRRGVHPYVALYVLAGLAVIAGVMG